MLVVNNNKLNNKSALYYVPAEKENNDKTNTNPSNSELIDHINFVSKINPYAAVSLHEDYLQSNPDDYIDELHYASELAKVDRLEEAEQELYRVKRQYFKMLMEYEESCGIAIPSDYDTHQENGIPLYQLPEELQCIWKNIIFTQFKILCNQNKLKEALIYFYNHSTFLNQIANFVIFYLRQRNDEFGKRERNAGYLFNQILEYNEKDLRNIVEKRQVYQNKGNKEKKCAYFNSDFPINEVLNEIKGYLPCLDTEVNESPSNLNALYIDFLGESYVFRCDNCGVVNGKTVNFFKVSVFGGTNNIYEFNPIEGYYDIPEYYDFTEFVKGGKVFKK